jgi:vacuolar-type H+-ATPase subunit C/Vma6
MIHALKPSEANKIIQSKKKAHLKEEMENIELLSNQNDRKYYEAVKKLNKGFKPRLDICKDLKWKCNRRQIRDNE